MSNRPEASDIREEIRLTISRRVRANQLEVPVLPHVAQQVLTLTSQPDAKIKDFVKIIEQDQQLTARLLKIANSPVYGPLTRITSIQQAVMIVGMRSLRDLVFSIALGERVFRSKLLSEPMRRVWEHSLAVAHIAKEVAQARRMDSDYAFLFGLLHDCGKPLLLETMERLCQQHQDWGRTVVALADDVMREFHEPVGGLLARAWHFNETMYAVIRFHREYTEAGKARPMALLVNVADLFARSLGLGSYAEEEPFDLEREQAIHDFQLTPSEVRSLLNALQKTTRTLVEEFRT